MNSSVYATYRLLEQQTEVGMILVNVMQSAFENTKILDRLIFT